MDKILTFDCYGTLLNTDILYEYVYNLAEKNGVSGNRAREIFINYEDRLMYGEDFMLYDQLLSNVLEYCDMELNTDIFSSQWENIIDLHRSFEPYQDVIRTLRYLKNRNYQLILMSNSTHDIMNAHMERLENLFDDYIVAEDTKCYKPNLTFFAYVSHKYHLSQKEHCHIAKGFWWDIVPCSKLGWKKIWVNRKRIMGNTKYQPYQEIATLDELTNLL